MINRSLIPNPYISRVNTPIGKLVFLWPVYLAAFCCFILGCNVPVKNGPVSQKEINLADQTDKLTIDRSPGILSYTDSAYRAQQYQTPYLKVWRLKVYGRYYERKGLYQKALPYVDSAIAIVDGQNLADSAWNKFYFAAHLLRASLLYELGNYQPAINTYARIKKQADSVGHGCVIGGPVNDYIGIILYRQGKYSEARKYFGQALSVLKNCSADQYNAGFAQEFLDNIGLCFLNEGNADSALVYYRKALHVIETGKFNRDTLQDRVSRLVCKQVVFCNIGQILVGQKKLDSAETLFKSAIALSSVTYKNETKYTQLSQMHLAELYGEKKQYQKMKLALDGLLKSLDTNRNDETELGWRKLMAEYYGSQQNQALAELKYYKSYFSLKDSLSEAKIAANAADINKEMKVQAQQLDIELLHKDNQLSHLYLWITIGFSFMAIVIVVLVYYYYKRGKMNIRALTVLNREIGEQKDQLEFAMDELEKSNADKERILKVVAHDLRNPVSGIAKTTGKIIKDGLQGDLLEQKLALVEKTAVNSLELINELLELDLSQGQIKADKKKTDMNETVKQCAALMQLIADKKNQKLQFAAPAAPLPVNMDKERVERLICNLLGNAIKFSPPGETVTVELIQKSETVLLIIRDNGIGIPPEMMSGLFNTFGGSRRKGTAGEKSFGLGLSICKQIADAHKGKIWVESEPGKGSVFFVELPLF